MILTDNNLDELLNDMKESKEKLEKNWVILDEIWKDLRKQSRKIKIEKIYDIN